MVNAEEDIQEVIDLINSQKGTIVDQAGKLSQQDFDNIEYFSLPNDNNASIATYKNGEEKMFSFSLTEGIKLIEDMTSKISKMQEIKDKATSQLEELKKQNLIDQKADYDAILGCYKLKGEDGKTKYFALNGKEIKSLKHYTLSLCLLISQTPTLLEYSLPKDCFKDDAESALCAYDSFGIFAQQDNATFITAETFLNEVESAINSTKKRDRPTDSYLTKQ